MPPEHTAADCGKVLLLSGGRAPGAAFPPVKVRPEVPFCQRDPCRAAVDEYTHGGTVGFPEDAYPE